MRIIDLKKGDVVFIKHIYSDYADKVVVMEITDKTIVLKHENGDKKRWVTQALGDVYIVLEEVKITHKPKQNNAKGK